MNRLTRWLFQAERIEAQVDAAEWKMLSRMGDGVKAGAQKCGVESYQQAADLCRSISSAYGEKYTLDSLACFLCLSQRQGEVLGEELVWPPRARPITCVVDLELDYPETLARTPSEEDEVPIPWALPRSPVADVTHVADGVCAGIAFSRIAKMRQVLVSVDAFAACALSQCARRYLFGGEVVQPLAREERVYSLVARMLCMDGPRGMELQRAGVSRGALMRVSACAWDWLDVLRGPRVFDSLWRDPRLLSLVIVRMAVKFELVDGGVRAALRLYREPNSHAQVTRVEAEVAEALLHDRRVEMVPQSLPRGRERPVWGVGLLNSHGI